MRRLAHAAAVAASLVTACGPGGDSSDTAGKAAGRDRVGSQVGMVAPPLESRTLDGASVSLAGLRGSPVLLNVWATWCHPCQDEIPVLERIHNEHGPRGLKTIGVTIDDPNRTDDIRAFAKRFGMTYSVWHDADQRVMPAFSVIGVPTTFLIDREGRMVWRKTGEVKAGDAALAAAIEKVLTGP